MGDENARTRACTHTHTQTWERCKVQRHTYTIYLSAHRSLSLLLQQYTCPSIVEKYEHPFQPTHDFACATIKTRPMCCMNATSLNLYHLVERYRRMSDCLSTTRWYYTTVVKCFQGGQVNGGIESPQNGGEGGVCEHSHARAHCTC